MNKIDVSVVLNMHRESIFLRPALISISACAVEVDKEGLAVELAVFDVISDPDNPMWFKFRQQFKVEVLHG